MKIEHRAVLTAGTLGELAEVVRHMEGQGTPLHARVQVHKPLSRARNARPGIDITWTTGEEERAVRVTGQP